MSTHISLPPRHLSRRTAFGRLRVALDGALVDTATMFFCGRFLRIIL